jgi:carboxyl-terminal processing protease
VGGGCAIFPHGAYWPSYGREFHGRSLAEPPAPAPGAPRPLDAAQAAAIQQNVLRRWSDEALAESARRMSAWEGGWVYADTLRTVSWFYVDSVSYRDLVMAGLASLRVALDNPAFQSRFTEASDPAGRARLAESLDALRAEAGRAGPRFLFQASGWLDAALKANRRTAGLPDGAVIAEMLFGAMDHLDPYSRYLTRQMREQSREQQEGAYTGVGLTVALRDGRLVIAEVLPGGAAAGAGLKRGDEILAIDGRPVAGLDVAEASARMRGRSGTAVKLCVRPAAGGEVREVVLVRHVIYLPAVLDEQIVAPEHHIGYVRLTAFTPRAARELRAALGRLTDQGARSLILDLRDNPGGSLLEAVSVAGLVLVRGRVLRTRGRMIGSTWTYDVPPLTTPAWRGPLAVLINEHTASAAEVVAAALAGHGRARLVGRRTYGKGAVQLDLPTAFGAGAVCLTIARVYDPKGVCLEGRGVEPDVEAADAASPPARPADDPVVRAAIADLAPAAR